MVGRSRDVTVIIPIARLAFRSHQDRPWLRYCADLFAGSTHGYLLYGKRFSVQTPLNNRLGVADIQVGCLPTGVRNSGAGISYLRPSVVCSCLYEAALEHSVELTS